MLFLLYIVNALLRTTRKCERMRLKTNRAGQRDTQIERGICSVKVNDNNNWYHACRELYVCIYVSSEEGFGWNWRGHVRNCTNKIQLLLHLSTSHITKKLEQCFCNLQCQSPPPQATLQFFFLSIIIIMNRDFDFVQYSQSLATDYQYLIKIKRFKI